MQKRDELISQVVAKLQSIKTLEDLKASEELLISSMESVFESSVLMFNDFLENLDSIPDEEKEPKILMFQDEDFFLPPDILNEMERLDGFSEGGDYVDDFSIELEKRMEPYMEQYSACAEKLMKKLFGGLIDGVGDALEGMAGEMGDLASGMADGMQEVLEEEKPFVFDYENTNTPRMLYELYAARKLDEVDKDSLIEDLEEQLQEDIWELERITDPNFAHTKEDDRIEDMRKRLKMLEPEMEKECTRLGLKSEAVEAAAVLKLELLAKLAPMLKEIKHYLSMIM